VVTDENAGETIAAVSPFSTSHRTPLDQPGLRPQPAPAAAANQEASLLNDFVADLESSLGDSFLDQTPAAKSHVATPPAGKAAPGIAPSFAGATAAAAAPALQTAARGAAAPAPAPESAGVDLADMFTELKQELDEETSAASGEDPETHYNLGVAFREMGLLDEAISELQKVCQAVEQGHPFGNTIQAYTWLAQCFLDKGIPEAAIRWYERALHLPGLDRDTSIALHYELGSSYEAAQNKSAALNHFMEVYGSNIDYRDVAERIRALRS